MKILGYLYNTVRELTLSFQSLMRSCILSFHCQMFGTRSTTSCVGIIYMHVHVRLGKIDGELIMPKAVITPGSHFYQGGVIYA